MKESANGGGSLNATTRVRLPAASFLPLFDPPYKTQQFLSTFPRELVKRTSQRGGQRDCYWALSSESMLCVPSIRSGGNGLIGPHQYKTLSFKLLLEADEFSLVTSVIHRKVSENLLLMKMWATRHTVTYSSSYIGMYLHYFNEEN